MEKNFEHKWQQFFESFMTIMGFLGSVATVPTVIKVWFTHPEHASGQSFITWSFYALLAGLWIFYGFYYKKTAIWATNIIYLILYTFIVIGILRQTGISW
ncbi:MAG: hypothetical protein K0S08_1659 [Gammaproteobacteria bacterium]|jgi:hypothetical protein|nr:hypothetical protein [Gammaproteobacteria bacterium]